MSEELGTMNELIADGSLQLPPLHLDIHVYSDRPAERFVFINMGKYKEGDRLAEGPAVREIRPDGVVLDQGGTRFLMPRQ
jgi:general secretion pathway protein B